jgi:large subunit ribosomal protein L21
MFAIIRTGGKQYKVAVGETLDVELLDSQEDKSIQISDVLLIGDGDNIKIGKPVLSGALVTLEKVDDIKAKKVIAYKFRKREGYHRTVGHRQKLSRVKVTKISI